MRTTRFLLSTIVLLLCFPSVSWAHSPSPASSVQGAEPLMLHPLHYRPASQTVPGLPPYVPSDIWQGYDYTPLYGRGVKGNGTSIAIIDAYGDPNIGHDLGLFDSIAGLPAPVIRIHYPDGFPTVTDSGWAVETALDVEWAHAVAPAATIDIVVTLDASLAHIYNGINLVATQLTNETVLSMSFGLSESQFPTTGSNTIAAHHQLFTTIASHGTSIFASSGDNGATVCCDPSYPASDSLVIAVGGTSLYLDGAANYAGEDTWSGSGAGSSTVFSKPSWQKGLGDSSRDIADVAYDADPSTGFLVVENARQFQVGGTSAGSPQWAALTALASQATRTRYGSIAAKLYNLTAYHDITTLSDGFFAALPGWDYPTGLGSPDANLLIGNLIQPPVHVRSSGFFQSLNITTTGNLQINNFTSTVSGTLSVRATNITTLAMVYVKNYTITNLRLQNQTVGRITRFLLSIPVNPYPLSDDITVTIQGSRITVQVDPTRRVNISGGGLVNINDVSIVIGDYNEHVGSPQYNPIADLALTGIVGVTDLSIVDLYFNTPVIS